MRRVGAWVASVTLTLAGCTTYGLEQRHGIDPILNPVAIETAVNNHIVILNGLARDANLPTSAPGDWYPVAEAGFNYIDDQCRAYFNHLFFLNREREQLKSGIIAASAATAAILSVTGASIASMAIVAEAFGFGATATDLVAGTYLYQLPPATTLGFVKELQLAYREGAAARRNEINSPTTAYHAIQDYLSLCLPPTIEAKIAEHISTARAVPDPRTGNGGASFGVTVASPPAMTRPEIRSSITGSRITEATRPISRPIRAPVTNTDLALGPAERTLQPTQIKDLRKFACLPENGDFLSARPALLAYLAKISEKDTTAPDHITARDLIILRRGIRDGQKAC